MDKKVAIIGSGNAFFKDEGMGLYAGKYIKENYSFSPDVVDVVDGGTLGFKLMPLLQEYDEVVIINTSSDEDKAIGEITVKTTDEFLDGSLVKKTANEVEIAEMLQICSLSEKMANVYVISVVPEDIIAVEVGLCESMKQVWDEYIQTVEEILKQLGITSKKELKVDLEEILEIFANPSIEQKRGF
ncbi:MAG: hydrogenase maturation protease [Epsilonproteobacteria bacterium]|nr:hydrogenase maturation protease [Campylobacterota bacterium]